MTAKSAYGMKLYIGGLAPTDAYTRVLGLQELDSPAVLNFGVKEIVEHKVPGDPGFGFADKLAIPVTTIDAIKVKLTWDDADPGQLAMLASEDDTRSSAPHYFKVLRRDDTGWVFRGYVTKWMPKNAAKEEISIDAEIEVYGGLEAA